MNSIVELRGCSKTFVGRRVLADARLDLHRGEIHGLIGQNGSGKSTLVKILAGYHDPDDGAHLSVDGRAIDFPLPDVAQAELGFSFVHQDLALFDDATVLENVSLGTTKHGFGWRISWRRERDRVADALARFGVSIDPATYVRTLAPAEKARVAIVRALEQLRASENAHLLVLDEPTPHLSRDGIEALFDTIRAVAATGVAVLLVTHRLDEIKEITDSVTVLRDGRIVRNVRTADVDEDDLAEALLGFKLDAMTAQGIDADRGDVLTATDLRGDAVHGVSLSVREGEVLGLTGIVGSGWEELPQLLFGARPARSGQLSVRGSRIDLSRHRPWKAVRMGLAFVPGDRQRDGALLAASVQENLTLLTIGRHFKHGFISKKSEERAAKELLRAFDVRPQVPSQSLQTLSGGNQQKVVIAKWLDNEPSILLLHEPTQGVDIGARHYIYGRLREAADRGTAVVIASAEYEDLAHVCDRVIVFRDGRAKAELASGALSYERVLTEAVGG